MKREIHLKLSLTEKQYQAIQTYATMLGTTKAGSVIHLIDLCSTLGEVYIEVIRVLNELEKDEEYQKQVKLYETQNPKGAYTLLKVKSELVKLSHLHLNWEKVNKVENFDFMSLKGVNK